MILRCAAVGIVVIALGVTPHAQWLNYPAPGIPRTKDGKPNLAAPAPRAANGKPDFSGVWTTDSTPRAEMDRLFPFLNEVAVPGDDANTFPKYFLNIFADYKNEDVPLKPEALQVFLGRVKGFGKDSPTTHCLPAGIPMGDLLRTPRRFIHIPNLMVILYEGVNPQRQIHLDGRKHVVDQPAWLGYSVGRWERDTLVVETRGFNDLGWLDAIGHPRTEQLYVVERFTRRDYGHMDVEVNLDDPGAYTKPFSIRYSQTLTPDTDVIEYVCAENEKDRQHLVGQ